MTCVAVEFNSCSVVYGGWTPEELYRFAPHTDVLAPVQGFLEIDESVVVRPRPSMMFATFETLRRFWDPHPPAMPSGAEVLRAGSTCCMQVSWKSGVSFRAVSDDLVPAKGVWLRFVSSFSHRKYTLERTPRQLGILLRALRVSFPHLLVPACSEPNVQTARGLLDFVETHAEAVFAYLPLLFFLYELSKKSVGNFFDTLEELVRRRQLNESNLLNALRPREASWFGWSAPKLTLKEDSLSEDVVFMDTHAARLPDSFKVKYMFSQSRREALERARVAATVLRDALLENVEAFDAAVEFCVNSSGKLLMYGCASWATDASEEQQQLLSESSTEDEKIKGAIAEFMNVASVLQGQIFGPILKTLVDAIRTSELNMETQFWYLRSMLECAKTVVLNEPLITGAKGAPKSSQAAQNPVLFRQVAERYGKLRQTFRTFKLCLEEELLLSENAIRRSLVTCCVHCLHAFTTFYDAFEARHHTRLIPSDEQRDASIHPLLQLFDTVKGQGKQE
ncbi:hypothetical protein C3747_198g48 [Trypanosoma cruzi]|nr:hypothetical protein C3747_198g48 [Trypanosoma cruzi]